MRQLEFALAGDFIDLHKLLKLVGLCDSGGSAKQLVASGAVSVDGAVELRKSRKIRAGQVVGFQDVRITVMGEVTAR